MFKQRWIVLLVALFLLASFSVSAQDTPASTETATPETITYQVHNGDTMGSIAARYHTTVGAIMRLNKLTNAQLVVIGQTLHIPASSATPQPTGTDAIS